MTGAIEATAAKVAAPAAKESWRLVRGFYQRHKPDHGPIGQCPNLNQNHADRLVMHVGVAPSQSPKHTTTAQFVHSAQAVAQAVFPEAEPTTDWSSRERVRFIVPRGPDDAAKSDRHRLEVFPNGFLLLQWGLDVRVGPDDMGPFPVAEFIHVLRRLHTVVRTPAFQKLHTVRRFEGRRRLDWRVGVCHSVSTTNGQLYVDRFDTPRDDAFKRARSHDLACSSAGFAPWQLIGLKPAAPFEAMLRDLIEDMTANAGITNPQQAADMIMEDHRGDWDTSPATAP